jgi:hypothetical protein
VLVCLCIPLSLPDNNSVKRCRDNEELSETSFSMQSVSCEMKVGD